MPLPQKEKESEVSIGKCFPISELQVVALLLPYGLPRSSERELLATVSSCASSPFTQTTTARTKLRVAREFRSRFFRYLQIGRAHCYARQFDARLRA